MADDLDDLPPLEDMSEQLEAARKIKAVQEASERVDKNLYESVVKEPADQPPAQRPPEPGSKIKVKGLVKAAQYNGLGGTVSAINKGDGRLVVELEGGKELKIKPDNVEVMEAFGGMKGGFLGSGASKKKAQKDSGGSGGPEVFKPTGKKEGLLDDLKSVGEGDKKDVPEWMRPTKDLIDKVEKDKELASAATNPRIVKAVDEVSKDPKAWLKYQDDPEIANYFKKMMGMFGQQFEEHENKQGNPVGGQAGNQQQGGKGAGGIEEIFTPQAKKSAMIQEISDSGAAKAKRAEMKKEPPPQRKGTTDYSKWDNLDSDDEDEKPSQVPIVPGMNVPALKRDDPKVAAAMADPRVMQVMQLLRTTSDPTVIEKAMADQDVAEKLRLLLQAGVIDIQRPS